MTINPKDIRVVSAGEEFRRKGQRKLIAISKVRIKFENPEDLERCIVALQESDERLAQRQTPPYDWQLVSVHNKELNFGVAWYDQIFFDEKKNVFKDPDHSVLFSRFGKVPDDFEVHHFVAEDK